MLPFLTRMARRIRAANPLALRAASPARGRPVAAGQAATSWRDRPHERRPRSWRGSSHGQAPARRAPDGSCNHLRRRRGRGAEPYVPRWPGRQTGHCKRQSLRPRSAPARQLMAGCDELAVVSRRSGEPGDPEAGWTRVAASEAWPAASQMQREHRSPPDLWAFCRRRSDSGTGNVSPRHPLTPGRAPASDAAVIKPKRQKSAYLCALYQISGRAELPENEQ